MGRRLFPVKPATVGLDPHSVATLIRESERWVYGCRIRGASGESAPGA